MAERPVRILVEHPDSLVRLDLVEELQAAGFAATACAGPRHAACPLTTEEGCADAASADLIVNALGTAHPEVYLAQRLRLPTTPVCVEASADHLDHLADILVDVRSSGPVPTGTALVERIREALDEQAL